MEGVELLHKIKSDFIFKDNLPPIYSVFAKNYAKGREGLRIKYFKFQDDLIELTSITFFGSNGYENPLGHFFDTSELEKEIQCYREKLDDYHKQGFIRIGLFDICDSILLGISERNQDTIWKLNGDWGDDRPYIEKLSENIFEFINSLKEVTIKMNLLVRKIDEMQLYQNWGEDFWRVRQENFINQP